MYKFKMLGVMALLCLSTLMIGAYGLESIKIEFKDLNGLEVCPGRVVEVVEESNFDHNWIAYDTNNTAFEKKSGNIFTFTTPEADFAAGKDTMRVDLELSLPDCSKTYSATIKLVPPWNVTYKTCIPITDTKSVPLNLACGISGEEIVGPDNTSETYAYTGGASGKLSYKWTINGFSDSRQNVDKVGDVIIDWSAWSKNATVDGTPVKLTLDIGKNYADELSAELGGVAVINPNLTRVCEKNVRVYPALNFSIDGDNVVCKDRQGGLSVTYRPKFAGPAPGNLAYSWSINGVSLGTNPDAVVDFSNTTLIPGFGNHEIALELTRTIPKPNGANLIIKGRATKIVKFSDVPQLA